MYILYANIFTKYTLEIPVGNYVHKLNFLLQNPRNYHIGSLQHLFMHLICI